MASFPPKTMRAYQYSSASPTIEANLQLKPSIPLPVPKPHQHLVQVIGAGLNPVDYKLPEWPIVGRLIISKPATPSVDFVGRIVTPSANSAGKEGGLKRGDFVLGHTEPSPLAGGALREYTTANETTVFRVPASLQGKEDLVKLAGAGVAGLTAYQTIVPRVKAGDRVFINGGSGGTGSYEIQFAKVKGAHVTTTCSTRNIELCKSLGADEVIDYTQLKDGSLVNELKRRGLRFNHAVDNVGRDDELLWYSHDILSPGAAIIRIAGDINIKSTIAKLKRALIPRFLGGMKGKIERFWPKHAPEDMDQITKWIEEGKVKNVVDQVFPFEDARGAFELLRTGRARGKIIVDVASKTYEDAWAASK